MASTTIGVVRAATPGERRVTPVPDAAARLHAAGMEVLLEAGVGTAATLPDSACAGATIAAVGEAYERADQSTTTVRRPWAGSCMTGERRSCVTADALLCRRTAHLGPDAGRSALDCTLGRVVDG